jgi:DNA-binding FrmR family transcriptional regulator
MRPFNTRPGVPPPPTRHRYGIEGQVRGIKKMIEDDRYGIDILQQMQTIKSALSKVEDAILKDHSHTCVASAIESGDMAEQQQKFNELVDLIARYKRH